MKTTKTTLLEKSRDKIDVTHELQARRCHGAAEQKPFASSQACRPKLFRITRQTRNHVWLLWEKYGTAKRGLSMRISADEFRKQWCPAICRDSIQFHQLYFRMTHESVRHNVTVSDGSGQ